MTKTKVPQWLIRSLAALTIASGGVIAIHQSTVDMDKVDPLHSAYIDLVAQDVSTSNAVKIALVMAKWYESGGKTYYKPYVDYAGKGTPLTVCDGITGKGVIPGKTYTDRECYVLTRDRMIESEISVKRLMRHWDSYSDVTKATFLDFAHHKGIGALSGSTMLRLANNGDLAGACRQNPRWVYGTVRGQKVALKGMVIRAESNQELCSNWNIGEGDDSNQDQVAKGEKSKGVPIRTLYLK